MSAPVPRCRNGHALTKKNTERIFRRGREGNRCKACYADWKRRRQQNKRPPRVSRFEVQRELSRTKVEAMPDCEYKRLMLEAFAQYDEWLATDKRPQRFGRKYPQQKAAKRRAA